MLRNSRLIACRDITGFDVPGSPAAWLPPTGFMNRLPRFVPAVWKKIGEANGRVYVGMRPKRSARRSCGLTPLSLHVSTRE